MTTTCTSKPTTLARATPHRRAASSFASALRALRLPAAVVGALGATALARADEGATGAAQVEAAAPARTPVDEAKALVEVGANTRANLTRAIQLYERELVNGALPAPVRADGWTDAARAYMRLGDLETEDKPKLAAYEKGRAAAARALAVDARHVDALFWDMANLACLGRTKGVMNSLFMVPELRRGLGRVLELNPAHHYARQTLAEIDHAVPGLAGGSDDRAEQSYLEVLRRDPAFTPTMVNLAELYRDQGKKELAREWANKALNATRSSLPNDWQKFDKPEARKVLRDLD